MADKKHRNPIRIATTTQVRENEAISALLSRELLYNRNNKTLGIVLEDEEGNKYRQIVSGLVDEVNITKNENNETKLKEDIVIDSITTQADHNGIDWKSQYKIAETSAERTIILLCAKNTEDATNIGVIGGEILEVGEGIYGHYQVSLTSKGSGLLKGATTFEQKAVLVRAKYNGTYYYGIKFKSTVPANIYFAGWDHFPDGASAPLYTSYNDADLSEIIELGGGDSGGSSGSGMTEEEKAEVNGKIDALQTSVAGKADTEHTHTKSQITDFPTSLPANGGTADRATGINYTGESSGCISAQQTSESYNDSSADWASYIICNHGNGTTYYHQMLRLPFSSDTIQLQRRVNGVLQGWKNVAIMENENTWSGRQNFTTAKASNKMVIPIGAPSQLEDGCIWIER